MTDLIKLAMSVHNTMNAIASRSGLQKRASWQDTPDKIRQHLLETITAFVKFGLIGDQDRINANPVFWDVLVAICEPFTGDVDAPKHIPEGWQLYRRPIELAN